MKMSAYIYRFATQETNGLLLYNGRYNEMHDFIALEIINAQVQFSFSLGGAEITTVRSHVDGGVTDGNFHEVFISYVNRVSKPIKRYNFNFSYHIFLLFLGISLGDLGSFTQSFSVHNLPLATLFLPHLLQPIFHTSALLVIIENC